MKSIKIFAMLFLLAGGLITMQSCKKEAVNPEPEASLYDRLGGIEAISAVTDQFLTNVVSNNEINFFFAETIQNPFRVANLRNHLIDQICEAAGGPCTYKGEDMKTAHAGMNITTAQFNSLVGDLVEALNQFNVPATEQNQLLSVLGGLAPDIVGQ